VLIKVREEVEFTWTMKYWNQKAEEVRRQTRQRSH